jgi:WD40 repeat protein
MVYRIKGCLSSGECRFLYDGFLSGHEGDILCMDYGGGDVVGTGSADHSVKLWQGAKTHTRKLHMVNRLHK